jgi:hypothetical protein
MKTCSQPMVYIIEMVGEEVMRRARKVAMKSRGRGIQRRIEVEGGKERR